MSASDAASPLHLFDAIGVEVEYMIVDAETLDVRPIADELLARVAGEPVADLDRGAIEWSNELALHVLELKTNGPTPDLAALPAALRENLEVARTALNDMGARLMPGAMHPWMDPERESRLWPHEYNDVYRAFDRIFGCRGHGWTNLQSVHVNLPFHGDEEFHRLHAAIRLVLPLTPALAASSPIVDGRVAGPLDARLVAYAGNSARVPSVAGRVIPEPVASRGEYEERILRRIFRDLAPLDPEGTLAHEWANARGAIARFGRGSIEIRLLDTQECPTADVAVVAAVVDAVAFVAGSIDPGDADRVPTDVLADLLDSTAREGERARLPAELAGRLGLPPGTRAGDAWTRLLERAANRSRIPPLEAALDRIRHRGPLGRRILAALGPDPDRDRLREVYTRLCDCLDGDAGFD
jgi:hypothetical protein